MKGDKITGIDMIRSCTRCGKQVYESTQDWKGRCNVCQYEAKENKEDEE
jgi:ribosomal protein L37E